LPNILFCEVDMGNIGESLLLTKQKGEFLR